MSNVVKFYNIYNFVAEKLKTRLCKMHASPEQTTIPVTVKNGKHLTGDDLIIYYILYDTAEKYFAQNTNLKNGEYFKHFLNFHNIANDIQIDSNVIREYDEFICNRFCLEYINCYSNKDTEFEIYNENKHYPSSPVT